MRSHDYIKQAANALQQAAAMRKMEVDELRRDITTLQHEEQQYLNDLKSEEHARLIMAGHNDGNLVRAHNISRARMIRSKESYVAQDYNKQLRDMNEALTQMQRSVDSLNSLAQDLLRQAA